MKFLKYSLILILLFSQLPIKQLNSMKRKCSQEKPRKRRRKIIKRNPNSIPSLLDQRESGLSSSKSFQAKILKHNPQLFKHILEFESQKLIRKIKTNAFSKKYELLKLSKQEKNKLIKTLAKTIKQFEKHLLIQQELITLTILFGIDQLIFVQCNITTEDSILKKLKITDCLNISMYLEYLNAYFEKKVTKYIEGDNPQMASNLKALGQYIFDKIICKEIIIESISFYIKNKIPFNIQMNSQEMDTTYISHWETLSKKTTQKLYRLFEVINYQPSNQEIIYL